MNERKLRFNFVDALILLLLALAAGVLLYVFLPKTLKKNTDSSETTVIYYTVEIQNIDTATAEDIVAYFKKNKNTNVLDGIDQKTVVGVLDDAESIDYQMITFDYEHNVIKKADVPDKSCIRVTLKANAVESDQGFSVNEKMIRVGEQYSLILPKFYGYGFCIRLKTDTGDTGSAAGEESEADETEAGAEAANAEDVSGNPGMIPIGFPLIRAARRGG